MIVDDERDLTDALALRLRAEGGFAVSVAYNGAEGLSQAGAFKPDVILLDLSMPVLDGWEMCRRLRADPDTRLIPLVVMTAWSAKSIRERAAEEGAAKVLLKPIDDQELLDALKTA